MCWGLVHVFVALEQAKHILPGKYALDPTEVI